MKTISLVTALLSAALIAAPAQADMHGGWHGGGWHGGGWHGGGWHGWHGGGWHGGWHGYWYGGHWWGPWGWWDPIVVAGVTYALIDGVWYRDYGYGYVEVEPPAGYETYVAPQVSGPAPAPPVASDSYFAYPRNGQSESQQAQDKYDCHKWAAGQSGFDPTLVQGGVAAGSDVAAKRSDYHRALTACLEGKGYTVR
ncbi:MAG: hypothetical protein JO218_17550 [Burkholderiales bacterium]|nr:hypothetical protein [Burkholderiales bacterium]